MRPAYINELSEALAGNGITIAFGVTGSGPSLDLITALSERGVGYYPTGHEAAAAIMAGAASRNGIPLAVSISIKGPGLTNMLPGIALNSFECRPAVSISESYSKVSPAHQVHKRIDHSALVKPFVRMYSQGANSQTIEKCFLKAGEEMPAPIHIDLAENEEIQWISERHYSNNRSITFEQLADRIMKCNRPALILGSMAARKIKKIDWAQFQVPVFTTAAAKGTIDEYSDWAAGVITGEIKLLSPESKVLNQADLILGIGLRHNEVVRVNKPAAPLHILDVIDEEIHNGFQPESMIIDSHLNESIQTLRESFIGKSWGQELIQSYRLAVEKELLNDDWLPGCVFNLLNNALPKDTAFVLDTGLFCTVGETILKARKPENFLGSSISRYMGVAIPTAIGLAIATKSPVFCAMGDGGIKPYFPEMKLAIEELLPIIFGYMTDGRYGSIAQGAAGKTVLSSAFSSFDSSWIGVAESIGCNSVTVKTLYELQSVLNQWSSSKGPLFIEMSFDPYKYMMMTQNLR